MALPLSKFSFYPFLVLTVWNYLLFRCGCLQVGDRLISVNHQPNLTLQEINSILELGNEPTGGKVTLQVEFDVADTVVPSSGVFSVKLAKRGVGLGITITGEYSIIVLKLLDRFYKSNKSHWNQTSKMLNSCYYRTVVTDA